MIPIPGCGCHVCVSGLHTTITTSGQSWINTPYFSKPVIVPPGSIGSGTLKIPAEVAALPENRYGWICPLCDCVFAPSVSNCLSCNSKKIDEKEEG